MMKPMSFGETIFLFFLALIIFGPKKLPEIARLVGKYMNQFRSASNEFRSQIEQEFALMETRQRQAALPPAAPPPGTASRSLPDASSTEINQAAALAQVSPSEVAGNENHSSESPALTEAHSADAHDEPLFAANEKAISPSAAPEHSGHEPSTPDSVTANAPQESHV
jgi:sec-independent protein translocase protein TatB